MQAGTCSGLTGIGDCVNTGWSPNWLAPSTFSQQIDPLFLAADEVVCPYCVLDRAESARIPGFNKQKYARIKAILDGLNCFANPAAQPAHVHRFDFSSETVWDTNPTAIGPTDRFY